MGTILLYGPLLAFLSLVTGQPSRAEEMTAVGALAGDMKPGEWRELKAAGYDPKTLMRGDDILAYAGRAAWDGKQNQALFIAQVHLKGPPVFIAYSVQDNRWRRLPTPEWAEDVKWFHAYENNAADAAGGNFYHHQSATRRVHRYDAATGAWSTLPELKADTGHGTALTYFPEKKGLVRVLNGEVCFYPDKGMAWSRLGEKHDMGPYHNVAEYSARHKAVLFGGGNGSRALYRLAADGRVTPAAKAPVDVGIGRSLNVADPVTGDLLVLAKGGRFLAYSPGTDVWRDLPGAGLPFPKYAGHSVSAVPIPPHGVVLFFSSPPQGMKTYLYKHADPKRE